MIILNNFFTRTEYNSELRSIDGSMIFAIIKNKMVWIAPVDYWFELKCDRPKEIQQEALHFIQEYIKTSFSRKYKVINKNQANFA